MKPHPEPPPNCQFFRKEFFKCRGEPEEWVFDVWSSSDFPLAVRFGFEGFNHKSPWISIIAAVARDGWATESYRAEKAGETAGETEQVVLALARMDEWSEWEASILAEAK